MPSSYLYSLKKWSYPDSNWGPENQNLICCPYTIGPFILIPPLFFCLLTHLPHPTFYFLFKKTPPVGLEPTTLRLKAARSTDWARKALTLTSIYQYIKIFYSLVRDTCLLFLSLSSYSAFTFKKRASPGIEPGPPAPKAGILPLNYKAFLLLLPYRRWPADYTPYYSILLSSFKKGGFGGNRTRATCTLSRYFTT